MQSLEQENAGLKKSLYELSIRFNSNTDHAEFPLSVMEEIHNECITITEDQNTVFNDPISVKNTEKKPYSCKHDLKGHLGAIYIARFSPWYHYFIKLIPPMIYY